MQWVVAMLILVAVATTAAAAPATAVVFHAPPDAGAATRAVRDALADTARESRLGWIDLTPSRPPRSAVRHAVRRGIEAYDALRFDDAVRVLTAAAAEIAVTGADGLDTPALSDLFLYLGLARVQLGDDVAAWDDLIIAATVDPTRALDPARFPPRAVAAFERAQAGLATRPRLPLQVDAPAGCAVAIDGAVRTRGDLVPGPHFVHVGCAGHRGWGARVVVDAAVTVAARPRVIAGPTEDELRAQVRVVGGDAIVVSVGGTPPVAVLRRLGADGREQMRAVVDVREPDAALRARAALDRLRAGAGRDRQRQWWHSRWVWVGAGALAATAVLVPIAVSRGGGGDDDLTVAPAGLPW